MKVTMSTETNTLLNSANAIVKIAKMFDVDVAGKEPDYHELTKNDTDEFTGGTVSYRYDHGQSEIEVEVDETLVNLMIQKAVAAAKIIAPIILVAKSLSSVIKNAVEDMKNFISATEKEVKEKYEKPATYAVDHVVISALCVDSTILIKNDDRKPRIVRLYDHTGKYADNLHAVLDEYVAHTKFNFDLTDEAEAEKKFHEAFHENEDTEDSKYRPYRVDPNAKQSIDEEDEYDI